MDTQLVGKLIEKCTQLEHALEAAGATGSGLRELMASLSLDPETAKALNFVRRVRNACAHDGEVSDDELREALKVAGMILKRGIAPERSAGKPRVRHYLWLEIPAVIAIYAGALTVSLTPRALNIATMLAFYFVMSWELLYACRCKNRKALLIETGIWCAFPLALWFGDPAGKAAFGAIVVSGFLPLVLSLIATRSVGRVIFAALTALGAGIAVWYTRGWMTGVAVGAIFSALLSFAGMFFPAKSR